MQVNEALRAQILNIVEEQLSSNNPQEVVATLARLQKEGFNKADSKKLIGQCVVLELYDMIRNRKVFNLDRYVRNLKRLPQEPEV